MEKRDLIRTLQIASEIEESHTAEIAKFFLEDFDWRGVDEEKAARARNMLKIIKLQTMSHQEMLDGILLKVMESDENEF